MAKILSQTDSTFSKKTPKRRSRKSYRNRTPDVHAKIDVFMAARVPMPEGSATPRPTGLDVILNHLWTQSMDSRKAEKLLWRYIRFYQSNGSQRRNPYIFLFGPDQLTYEEVMRKRRRGA